MINPKTKSVNSFVFNKNFKQAEEETNRVSKHSLITTHGVQENKYSQKYSRTNWKKLAGIKHILSHTIRSGGKVMKKSLLIGAMLGIVGATCVYASQSRSSVKKLKRAFIHKLEDAIM